jgi:AAA family ATP:ADP antiporter
MVLYCLIEKLGDSEKPECDDKKNVKKIKFSLKESFQEVINSKHLTYLATIVVAYFFVINTVEVIWKEQLRLAYPSPIQFNQYMNSLTTMIGVLSTGLGFFVGSFLRRFGWAKTALSTPIVMLLTSLLFFIFVVFKEDVGEITAMFGTSPLAIAVFLGAFQNCLSKGAKYSIFDSTKEMAFIPLSSSARIKGKAAIDGVMSRLGKSGASFALQSFILIFGSLIASTPYITGLMLLVIVAWISAARRLGYMIDQFVCHDQLGSKVENEHEDIGDEQNPAVVSI